MKVLQILGALLIAAGLYVLIQGASYPSDKSLFKVSTSWRYALMSDVCTAITRRVVDAGRALAEAKARPKTARMDRIGLPTVYSPCG